MENLRRILFVVVSCTRDVSREEPFRQLIRSLNDEHRRVGFRENLMLFDNASTTRAPLDEWEVPAIFSMCPENVGYWTALKWSMENASHLFDRKFDYVHPIESDLVFYKIERLAEAVQYLDQNVAVQTVRTQEFSVASRRRFFKGSLSLFPCRRSRVADYNGVTHEKAWFSKVEGHDRLYLTNWHAKVPALHRFDALYDTLAKLAKERTMTELDFMRIMRDRAENVALLNGGVYFTTSYRPKRNELAGSYSDASTLTAAGYRQTRTDSIDPLVPEPAIEYRLDTGIGHAHAAIN